MKFPIAGYSGPVEPAWIDENGHVDTMRYKDMADLASHSLFQMAGIGEAYRVRTRTSFFQAEMHICYERELLLGDNIEVLSWLLGADAKRIHHAHEIRRAHDGARAATVELMTLHVSLVNRRTTPIDSETLSDLMLLFAASAMSVPPAKANRRISMQPG